MLQEALSHFNTDKHQWYGWKNLEDGEVYSNLKLNDETATMPTEEEVNAKIAEITVIRNRKDAYDSITDQLDKLYHDMTAGKLDVTGEWYKARKKVKDDNPKRIDMPGSIKIDDGSGNYTILTNGGSLGSDKTITIPNETATIATTTATDLGGLVKLASGTFSSSILTNGTFATDTYDRYLIHLTGLIPTSDGAAYRLKFMSGASSYLTGNYYTGCYYTKTNASGNGTQSNVNTTAYSQLSLNTVGNTGTENAQISIELLNPRTAKAKHASFIYMGNRDNFDNEIKSGFIQWSDATAVTGVEITPDTGTFSSGTYQIYGFRK